MRDILFKAKTTAKEKREFNNVWIQGDLITSNGKYYIHPKSNSVNVKNELGKIIVMHEVIPDTICQYTGLTDKNGNKIWENDVVRYSWTNGQDESETEVVTVKYDNYGYTPYIWEYDCDGCCLRCETLEVEVIGNIFDNSELLIGSEE